MTPRDRVIAAVNHQNTDFVPYQLDMTIPIRKKLEEHYQTADFEYSIVGNHLVREKHKNNTIINDTEYLDIYGVHWRLDPAGDIGVVKNYIFSEDDLSLYEFITPDADMINQKCTRICSGHADRFKIYEIGFSLFERAWSLRSMQELLIDFIINKSFAHELLDKITEYNLQVIDIAAKHPVDCIMLGDDWGGQRGLIMGKPIWNEFIRPRLQKMSDRIKSHGKYFCVHSCGDNNELLGDFIDVGIDIYNTFQPEVYDIVSVKKNYGSHLTIYGGISTQQLLSKGTPGQVYDETKRTMEILGNNGGYICAPTHQIPRDIEIDNVLAFINAVQPK